MLEVRLNPRGYIACYYVLLSADSMEDDLLWPRELINIDTGVC
jgi:hypothetical protein